MDFKMRGVALILEMKILIHQMKQLDIEFSEVLVLCKIDFFYLKWTVLSAEKWVKEDNRDNEWSNLECTWDTRIMGWWHEEMKEIQTKKWTLKWGAAWCSCLT